MEQIIIDDLVFEVNDDDVRLVEYVGSSSKIILPDKVDGKCYSIFDWTFSSCTNLESIIIPSGVTSIGENAFCGCRHLDNIIISEGVVSIERDAFSNCSNLMSVTIPSSITSIGEDAFLDCIRLIEVHNYSKLNLTVGSKDFIRVGFNSNSIYNEDETVSKEPNGLGLDIEVYTTPTKSKLHKTDDGFVFYVGDNDIRLINYIGTKSDLVLPKNYKGSDYSIADYAFEELDSLKSVTIPGCVTSIGNVAFAGCINLESIIIPESVVSIGNGAFWECQKLKSISIPSGVTSIGDSTFKWCTSLMEILIPGSVIKIGKWAFLGCCNLMKFIIPSSITSIGEEAFYDCYRLVEVHNYSKLNITAGEEEIGGVGFYAIEVYTTPTKSKLHKTEDGFVFYVGDKDIKLINYIGTNSDLVLPDNYKGSNYSIADYAFYREQIKSITIPKSITSIGMFAFYKCFRLEIINMTKDVTSIGDYAFFGCTSLKSIIIPKNVVTIEEGLFLDCHELETVIIPASVKIIEEDAFSHCEKLKYIYYEGSFLDYSSIKIELNKDEIVEKLYYYSETKPDDNSNKYWHYVDDIITIWE